MNKRPCNVHWFSEKNELKWLCPNTMGPQHPQTQKRTRCWHYKCPGRAEPILTACCAYELCNEPKREDSNYCSLICRKRKNRRDYKLRKQHEKRKPDQQN